jgi:hypothetical protein
MRLLGRNLNRIGGISMDIEKSVAALELDFSNEPQVDSKVVDFNRLKQVIVHVPLPSFGSSNSHIDLCSDLLYASWALESLAACAGSTTITVGSSYYKPNITAILHDPLSSLQVVLDDCALLFSEDDAEPHQRERLDDIRNRIWEYEEQLHESTPRFPDIVDWYFANLMAANYEFRSEASDFYKEQMAAFPERQVGFFRSAYSVTLGGNCYASNDGWLLTDDLDIDVFFRVTHQKYRLKDFIKGEFLAVNGHPLVVADGLLAHFPMRQFLRSQICAGFAASREENDWNGGPFDWLDQPFTPIPRVPETPWSNHSEEDRQPPHTHSCLIHPTGTLIILFSGRYRHFLYDAVPLNLVTVKRVHTYAAELVGRLSAAAGVSVSLACNWKSLSDEDFEQLCYDLIFLHPKFDADTIRKLGKSRSRDGGRDIEVFELARWPREKPKKWIFQCKLVKSASSLGASKVLDVGDMLDQYNAQGFGVLTSTSIDATLYDKLDKVCGGRGVEQMHMSVLELERALSRNLSVKNRFFPVS